jgi:hypothetical protein
MTFLRSVAISEVNIKTLRCAYFSIRGAKVIPDSNLLIFKVIFISWSNWCNYLIQLSLGIRDFAGAIYAIICCSALFLFLTARTFLVNICMLPAEKKLQDVSNLTLNEIAPERSLLFLCKGGRSYEHSGRL